MATPSWNRNAIGQLTNETFSNHTYAEFPVKNKDFSKKSGRFAVHTHMGCGLHCTKISVNFMTSNCAHIGQFVVIVLKSLPSIKLQDFLYIMDILRVSLLLTLNVSNFF